MSACTDDPNRDNQLYAVYLAYARVFRTTRRHRNTRDAMRAAVPAVVADNVDYARWRHRFEQHDKDPNEQISKPCPRCGCGQYFDEDIRAEWCIVCKRFLDGCHRDNAGMHSGGPRCVNRSTN